jgi:2'-5' RNA ligase
MDGCDGDGVRINSFALVSYLPEPLAGFLDGLRRDLVQGCHAKSHVTVLPPRPLLGPVDEAWREVKDHLQSFGPFHVELGKIEIFPTTDVIYLSVGAGHDELERMHQALNSGRLAFQEPFQYHPHLTLAQELEHGQVSAAVELAERRWREFSHPRGFTLNRLTFVQNTMENRWADLWGRSLTCRDS